MGLHCILCAMQIIEMLFKVTEMQDSVSARCMKADYWTYMECMGVCFKGWAMMV